MTAPDHMAQNGEGLSPRQARLWFAREAAHMRGRGATWFRAAVHEDIDGLLLMEGWNVRPEKEPPPHFMFTEGEQ